MTFLPIVDRELRVAARKPATYFSRAAAAMAAILVATFAWMILVREAPRQTGFVLFVWLSVIAYIYCFFMGFLTTADCVSEEKREGTLGLLFLTDLKGYDVVFGKLVASSLHALYGLLAIFPVLGIALLMGGVALAEFARVMLSCGVLLLFSLALGIFTSSICTDERKAMSLSFLILILFTAGFPALGLWLKWKLELTNPPAWLFIPSPGYLCVLAFDEPYKGLAAESFNFFIHSAVTLHGLTWLMLLLACYIVPRVWQDRVLTPAGARARASWRDWSHGAQEFRREFRRRALDLNPFYWVVVRDRLKGALAWLPLLLAAVIWAIGLIKAPNDWRDVTMFFPTAILLHTVFKVWVAMEAPRRIGLDRQSGALELLLSTPLSVREILRGQFLALLRQFGPPVLVVSLADVLFMAIGLRRLHDDLDLWVFAWCAIFAVFVTDLVALAWTGMWLGLTSRKPRQAGPGAIFRICSLPWLLFFGVLGLLAFADEMGLINVNFRFGSFLFGWTAISLLTAALFGVRSRRKLEQRFRVVATQRFDVHGGFFARLFGTRATTR